MVNQRSLSSFEFRHFSVGIPIISASRPCGGNIRIFHGFFLTVAIQLPMNCVLFERPLEPVQNLCRRKRHADNSDCRGPDGTLPCVY